MIDEQYYYRDLNGSYHPKNESYKFAYAFAAIACLEKEGVELVEDLINVNAQVAHLLNGEERDAFYGLLDSLDHSTRSLTNV